MTKPPLKIRCPQRGDFESLYRIDRVCFPDKIAFSRAELGTYLRHPQSIARVAEGAGRILGFVLARVENASCAHILTLDVVPEVRQRKIGTTLMNALHDELGKQGIGKAVLEVGVGNVAARRLYEKLHYKYLGKLDGYYHGREDAYQMARLVSSELG